MTLDRDQLRKAAANRRSDATPERQTSTWDCEFCQRSFATEMGFMGHHCRERKKLEELKSPLGQAAYGFYSEWMRLQKRSVPPQEKFMDSRFFHQFVEFAKWSDTVSIPSKNSFIALMVENSVIPAMWCRPTTYEAYLKWYDTAYPPEVQFVESLDKLKELAIDLNCRPGEVYQRLGVAELLKLVRRRKLSPWLMVTSERFLNWVKDLPAQDKDDVVQAINFMAYVNKLKANPSLSKILKAACKDEGI